MSKLTCQCGHVIVDQTYMISYKGRLLPDTEKETVATSLTDSIDALSVANQEGKRLEWINQNFVVPPYPTDLKDSSMVYDLYSSSFIDATKTIYECESCGRILIQVGKTEKFKSFKPETDDTKGILKGQR